VAYSIIQIQFGSIEDRAAYWMVKDTEEKGILKKVKKYYYY